MKTGSIMIASTMVAALLLAGAAAAQTTAPATDPSTIYFGPAIASFVAAIVPIAVSVVAAAAAWAVSLFNKATGLRVEFSHRDALEKFLSNQAGRFLAPLSSWQGLSINVGNKDIARLAQEAVNRIPDAVKFFGLDTGQIAQRIVDKIGLATATSIEPKVD